MSTDTELKARLLQTDDEFQQLAAQHHELDDRLHQMTVRAHLSEPEQVEQVTLKKRKLQLKDRMEQILRRQRALPETFPDAASASAAGG